MILKFRTKTGHIQDDFEIEELLEVDGEKYNASGDVRDVLINFEARLQTLEDSFRALIGGKDDGR